MTERTFAPWVEPIARELREGRQEIAHTARQFLPELWSRPSVLGGWSNKDLLTHLAVGDWVCQTIVGAIVENRPLDLGEVANIDWVNEGNAQRLAERKARPVEELIAEVEAEGEETQALLSRLRDEDEERTQEGAPMTLGAYLRGFPGHDRQHLSELRQALDSMMM